MLKNARILKWLIYHCVKSVRIWSYCGPYFPAFGQNTGPKNTEYGHFFRSVCDSLMETLPLFPFYILKGCIYG